MELATPQITYCRVDDDIGPSLGLVVCVGGGALNKSRVVSDPVVHNGGLSRRERQVAVW